MNLSRGINHGLASGVFLRDLARWTRWDVQNFANGLAHRFPHLTVDTENTVEIIHT